MKRGKRTQYSPASPLQLIFSAEFNLCQSLLIYLVIFLFQVSFLLKHSRHCQKTFYPKNNFRKIAVVKHELNHRPFSIAW